jgi:hypothetical protein
MTVRSDIVKRIQKREETILDLRIHVDEIHSEIAAHLAVVDELKGILKTLPPDDESEQQTTDPTLRKGSDMAKVRDHLRVIGKPTHVDDLLKLLGKPVDKKNRASVSGQMSLYARKNQIFTRPEPNTFGLREWEVSGSQKDGPPALPIDDSEALPLSPNDDDDVLPAH